MHFRWFLLLALLISLGCPVELQTVDLDAGPKPLKERETPTVLVFTKTTGYRHHSIATGIRTIKQLGHDGAFQVVASEDSSMFRRNRLRDFQAVIFLNTTGDILNTNQQRAFENWYRGGGGFLGIHSAADTEYQWSFYGKLIGGAYFKSHPAVQKAMIHIQDAQFPATRFLPQQWERTDEWYTFRRAPNTTSGITVAAEVRLHQNDGPKTKEMHPTIWYHTNDGGRMIYTGGGHTKESYAEPFFRAHLKASIQWVAGIDNVHTGQP